MIKKVFGFALSVALTPVSLWLVWDDYRAWKRGDEHYFDWSGVK